jgi:lipopolysaccharide/colanic/teichoic acid biosynthesis glycosyltransferase
MYVVSGLTDLEPVAERIGEVEPLGSWDRVVVGDLAPCPAQVRRERVEIVGHEPGMRLPGCGERVFDPHVELLCSGPKPTAATSGERSRLGDLREPEQPAVERPCLVLAARGGSDLHVVDACDRHLPGSTIDRVQAAPPPLEETLVRGYVRLATEAEHRRIDLELRALDVTLATLFGLIALPLALVIAVVQLVASGRPVLYRGERVGRRGRFFEMLKFRTMRPGAEERIGQYLGEELVQATDAELTRLGRWLKVSQLDEIPQLWNVLRGDMSFVGPRPIRPRFFAELAHDLPAYWQRLVVRPGLTGFAQVRRGYETSMAEKLAHDLEWIADRSVRLYLRTVIVTGFRVVAQVFGRRN